MKILGIDPGLLHTGWGIIEVKNNSLKYIECGAVSTNAKSDLADRLMQIHQEISKVVNLFKPDECAVEETFVNKNALSSLKLGHARGAAMLSVALSGIKVFEYSPNLIKKSVVGVGKAEKEQVEVMVKFLLPGATISTLDASDALAVAICHSSHRRRI